MSVMCLSESIIKIFVNSDKCLFVKKIPKELFQFVILTFGSYLNNLLYLVSLNFMFYRK